MPQRKIIKIDKNKCNGCGKCLPNCPEGAIQVIAGKARLVSDLFCDGLGACLRHCPQGAIEIEERQAQAYDEKKAMDFRKDEKIASVQAPVHQKPQLRQWPVQLALVPTTAPYFEDADLLLAADCVGFSYADFHQGMLKDRILLVACPKLDNLQAHKDKINMIIRNNNLRSVTYARMEVPCCAGLKDIICQALADAGKTDIPFEEVIIGIRGQRL